MSHDHYKKDVRHLDMIDVYRVIELFDVTHPALQHAMKKVLCAGDRGAKDWEKDVQEAIDSLNRALQMRAEDCDKVAPKPTSDDPHAELRKTWKPGQRWQCRIPGPENDIWSECANPPAWVTGLEYRRHPDDAKEGHG